MPEDIQQLKQEVETLKAIIANLVYSDRYIFQKNLQLQDGRNIQVATSTGTKIGTASSQKLSVYGVSPVVQAGAISAPSTPSAGYSQVEAQSAVDAINSIRTALTNFGITA